MLTLSTVSLKLNSAAITGAIYNAKARTLDVTYAREGRTYRYYDCQPQMVEDFAAAPSKGKFINSVLKPACLSYRLR